MKNKIVQIILTVISFIASLVIVVSSITLYAANNNDVNYRGTLNFNLSNKYYIVVDDDVIGISSSNEDICNFYRVEEEDISYGQLIYFVKEKEKNKKYYAVNLKQVGSCYLYIENNVYIDGNNISEYYDLVVDYDYSNVRYVDIFDGENTTRIETRRFDKYGNYKNEKIGEYVFEFGKRYSITYSNMYIRNYKGSIVSNNEVQCVLEDGSISKDIVLNDKGNLFVWGFNNGTFKFVNDTYGGFEFNYKIQFSNKDLLNDLYSMYFDVYGSTINSPSQLSFDFYNNLDVLKFTSTPDFLSDDMFREYFVNVDEIVIKYKDTYNGFVNCYVPSKIKEITLENYDKDSVFANVHFYGDKNNSLTFNINGSFKLRSHETSVFSDFKSLTVVTNTLSSDFSNYYDNYFGVTSVQQTYIFTTKGSNQDTFKDISYLSFVINHPTVIVGADGEGANHNVHNDYIALNSPSYAESPKSFKPTDGCKAINVYDLKITANTSFACVGGIGGSCEVNEQVSGTDGNENGLNGSSGGNGGNGSYAIDAYSVEILEASGNVIFYGGDGGDGANGTNGTNGEEGLWNDTYGGDGGHGGNGGNGACPLIVSIFKNKSDYLSLYFGKGGKAGIGGAGGKGHNGSLDFSEEYGDGDNGKNGVPGANANNKAYENQIEGKSFEIID